MPPSPAYGTAAENAAEEAAAEDEIEVCVSWNWMAGNTKDREYQVSWPGFATRGEQ